MIICLLCRTLGSLFLLLKLLQDIDDIISLRPNASVNGLMLIKGLLHLTVLVQENTTL